MVTAVIVDEQSKIFIDADQAARAVQDIEGYMQRTTGDAKSKH